MLHSMGGVEEVRSLGMVGDASAAGVDQEALEKQKSETGVIICPLTVLELCKIM